MVYACSPVPYNVMVVTLGCVPFSLVFKCYSNGAEGGSYIDVYHSEKFGFRVNLNGD